MEPTRPSILDCFPTPVAYGYALIFDRDREASTRRWALCFTAYQALRLITLPLVGQYLRADLGGIDFERDKAARSAVEKLNTAIAGIRAPFFSDWITLVETLRRRLPALGLTPLFPGLDWALDALKDREPREFTLPGQANLDALRAILALRNATAHGAIPDERAAARHIDAYLPVLHRVLDAFAFLGESLLLVLEPSGPDAESGTALVRELRGARPGPPVLRELPDELVDVFAESPAAMVGPAGHVEPLYPLLNPQPEERPADDRETVYLYDGHYGIRVEARGEPVEKGHIHYLGVHHRVMDQLSCERLRALLRRRDVHFYLPKEEVAPWTIAETAPDYSRQTLAGMLGSKYLPACYVPFPDLERHFDAFLAAHPPRVGLVVTGLAGSGKSAFLAHRVERLLGSPAGAGSQDLDPRANPNLVFFLRGNGIAPRAGGVSLYHDVAEKLGVATEPSKGIATFGELLEHFDRKWKQDRVGGRRLILIIDGLNEAPEPQRVLAEALAMIEAAARFPWCKIAVSTRMEWLTLWSDRQTAQEASPLERCRRCLYYDETPVRPDQPPDPVVGVEPFTAGQAAAVYGSYQAAGGAVRDYRVPACPTPWEALAPRTRGLLVNPLYLHLFMEAFNGRPAEDLAGGPNLFRRYVEQAVREHPGLTASIEAVIGHLRADLARPTADLSDDDVNAIRERWARSLTAEEREQRLHPVEDLAHEGWVLKRVREEGGGYRFVFQEVAEYLVYLDLRRSKPAGEDELDYWARQVVNGPVFGEYAGSFGFLLRDWAELGRLGLAARIVEGLPDRAGPRPVWFSLVVTRVLVEQARAEHAAGRASPRSEAAARMLVERGGWWTAHNLAQAGKHLCSTALTPDAIVYYQASVGLLESIWNSDPGRPGSGKSLDEQLTDGMGLAEALTNLAVLLSRGGRDAEAERAFRRSAEVCETLRTLWSANPADGVDDCMIDGCLAFALSNLGDLLLDSGRTVEAERAYRRSADISQAQRTAHPADAQATLGLASTLRGLAILLSQTARVDEAERAFRRSVEICEEHLAAHSDDAGASRTLALALNSLGILLSDSGRTDDAERVCRNSVAIYETLWAAQPDDVHYGGGLGAALVNLGRLLRESGQTDDAERAYRRAAEIFGSLWAANPGQVREGSGLGLALNNLGNLLRDSGRMVEAERAFGRSAEVYEALWAANPGNLEVGGGLALMLGNFGVLLFKAGRAAEAERPYRRSVEVYEALWAANRGWLDVGRGLAWALDNLGLLLGETDRRAEAERVLRRSVSLYETLWAAYPGSTDVAQGLTWVLDNLGSLLSDLGREAEVEQLYSRSAEIRARLLKAAPGNVNLRAEYARSLCCLGRFDEARRLVAEVLAVCPTHHHAREMQQYLDSV